MIEKDMLTLSASKGFIGVDGSCSNAKADICDLPLQTICATAYNSNSTILAGHPDMELHPEKIFLKEMSFSSDNTTKSICEVYLNETDTAKFLRQSKFHGNDIIQPFIMFTAEGMRCVPAITEVKSYDNKTTVVFFSDGTKEHANCSENDTYSLEYGISVCLLKKLLGGNETYKKIVNTAAKSYREKLAAEEAEKLRKKEEHEARMQAEKETARRRKEAEERREKEETEKQISIMAEAFRRAMQQNNEVS